MFGLYLSTFLMVVIGLDRWSAISKPLQRSKSGRGRARSWVWTAWILSAIFRYLLIMWYIPTTIF